MTGEKYTQARRALLASDDRKHAGSPAGRPRHIANEYLAELGAHQEALDTEFAVADLAAIEAFPDGLRDFYLLQAATQPVIWVVIKLPAAGLPGTDLEADAGWAAMMAVTRREVLTLQRVGIDAGLADANLRLIDMIESRIGLWPEGEWTKVVRARVRALIDARDRGRERGPQFKPELAPSARRQLGTQAWMLRHPRDHYFSRARVTMTDPALVAYLDQLITTLAPRYAALAAADWSSEEAQAEIVVEIEFCEPVPTGWKVPVPATVVGAHRGDVAIDSRVGLRLVADPDAPFNGTLLSVLAGERWLVCGTLLDDGTLLPSDGTRRLRSG